MLELSATPAGSSYIFNAWTVISYTDSNGSSLTVPYTAAQLKNPNFTFVVHGNLDIEATWTIATEYTVAFQFLVDGVSSDDAAEVTLIPDDVLIEDGDDISLYEGETKYIEFTLNPHYALDSFHLANAADGSLILSGNQIAIEVSNNTTVFLDFVVDHSSIDYTLATSIADATGTGATGKGGTIEGTASGTLSGGSSVALTAVPAAGYLFKTWTVVSDTPVSPADTKTFPTSLTTAQLENPTLFFDIASNVTLKAQFIVNEALVKFSVTAIVSGVANGTWSIHNAPAVTGSTSRLIIAPSSGYLVSSVTVTTGTPGAALTINADKTIVDIKVGTTNLVLTIVFAADPAAAKHSVTVTSPLATEGSVKATTDEAGTLPLDTINDVTIGTVVHVTATPSAVYDFVRWDVTKDGAPVTGLSTNATLSLTVAAGVYVITAVFAYNSALENRAVTITQPTIGGGIVGVEGTFKQGEVRTFVFEPDEFYQLDTWVITGAYDSLVNSTSLTTTTISIKLGTADINVSAVAKTDPAQVLHTVTYAIDGASSQGTVLGEKASGAQYRVNSETILTAAPTPGYDFVGWAEVSAPSLSLAGVDLTASTIRFTILDDVDVKAVFTASAPATQDFIITINTIAGGNVAGGLSGNYAAGTNLSLTAIADEGYVFDAWVDINGVLVSREQTLDITVSADATYTARFVRSELVNPEPPIQVPPTPIDTFNWIIPLAIACFLFLALVTLLVIFVYRKAPKAKGDN